MATNSRLFQGKAVSSIKIQLNTAQKAGVSNWRNPILFSTRNGRRLLTRTEATSSGGLPIPPLDLTEENLDQLFDTSVGITGEAELAELDGPFVKVKLRGRFWHKRSTVVARLAIYLKQRIPDILGVDIADEKQLDDSPENLRYSVVSSL